MIEGSRPVATPPLFALLAEAADLTAPLAGKSTLNRLELSAASVEVAERDKKIAVDHTAVDRLRVAAFLQAHATAPAAIVLDLDATDDPVHGAQEGRFFHGYYGGYCHQPLYIFAGEHLLCARLRTAAPDGGSGRQCGRRGGGRPDRRAGARGVARGAPHAPRGQWLLPRCPDDVRGSARRGLRVFGLAKNARITAAIADELATAAAACAATGAPARVFAERTYETHDSLSRARRVVAKAEQLTAGTADEAGKRHPRFVVTSLAIATVDARTLHEDVYCARGDMENRSKEQQLMLFADRTSAATLRANQLRLYFSSIAYLLLHPLRRLALAGTTLAHAQCPDNPAHAPQDRGAPPHHRAARVAGPRQWLFVRRPLRAGPRDAPTMLRR